MNTRSFPKPNRSFARAGAMMLALLALLAALPVARASAAEPMSIQAVQVAAQSGTLTYGTAGTATYTITLTAGGGQNADVPATTLSVSGLPAGATDGFSPNPTGTCTGNGCTVTSTLTVTTIATTPAVTGGSFTVTATPPLPDTPVNGSGSITINRVNLTISGISIDDKVYDGTQTAAISGTPMFDGVLNGDNVSPGGTTLATFASRNAIASPQAVTVSGYTVTGPDQGNYTVSQPSGLTATISQRPITVTAAANTKDYDATTNAAAIPTYSALGTGDTPGFTETYDNPNAGASKTLIPAGKVNDNNSGNNYTYNYQTNTSGVINALAASVTPNPATKVYGDGDPAFAGTLVGFLAIDNVSATYSRTAGETVGGTYTISANLSATGLLSNYIITSSTASFTITAKPLTVTGLTAVSRPYNGTNAATLTGTAALFGVVFPDDVALSGTPLATFADVPAGTGKNVGTGKTVNVTGYTLAGTTAPNYTLTEPIVLTADITPAPLSILSGVTANNKVYDATNAVLGFTISPTPTFSGFYLGDVVTIVAGTGTFTDIPVGTGKNVGNAKPVTATGFTLGGTDGPNYLLAQPTGLTANITQLPVTVTATAASRAYNGTRSATATLLFNRLGTDAVTATYTSALFADKNVGTAKTVTVTGISLAGLDMPNYSLSNTTTTATANITAAPLTITAKNATKVYGTTLDFTGKEFTNSAMPATDYVVSVTLSSTGAAANSPLGPYPIVPSDAYIWGGAANYAITYVDGTLTVVPPAPAFQATPASKSYGLVKIGTILPAVFTIKNTGGSNLVFGPTVKLVGANIGQFSLGKNTCAGATLAPNAACQVTAIFKPTVVGLKSASIWFSDNTAAHVHTIALAGRGAVELAINGGFNTYPSPYSKVPTSWVASGFVSTDGKNTVVIREGTASIRMANSSARVKTLKQTRAVAGGLAGNTLQLSVWGRGQAIPAGAGLVRVQVQLYNGTSLVQTSVLNFPTGTYAFQQRKAAFVASRAYNKIVITLTYSKATGVVWFDGLSLLRSP